MSCPWNDLRKETDKIEEMIESAGLKQSWNSHGLSDLGPRPTLVVVTGSWNSGKSTLINGLLGHPGLLPSGPIPMTSTVVEIREGQDIFSVNFEGKKTVFSSLKQFQACLLSSEGRISSYKDFAEVHIPAFPFRHAILVDTPGTNAPIEIQERITNAYVPKADAIIYVLQCALAGQAHDVNRLKRILARTSPKNVFVVMNHCKDFSATERSDLVGFVRKQLSNYDDLAGFFFTEAVLAEKTASNQILQDESGLSFLREALVNYLRDRGETAVWQRDLRLITRIVKAQSHIWSRELIMLDSKEQDLKSKLEQVTVEKEHIERDLRRSVDLVKARLESLKSEFRNEMQGSFSDIRSEAQKMVLKVNDPSSEADCATLVESLTVILEQAMQPLVTLCLQKLEDEVSAFDSGVDVSHFETIVLQIPTFEPTDFKEILEDHIREAEQLLENMAPYLNLLKDPKLVSMTDSIRKGMKLAGGFLNKFLPILEIISQKMREEEARSCLMHSVGEQLAQIQRDLDSEFLIIWEKIAPKALDAVRSNYDASIKDSLEPLNGALEAIYKGEAETRKRTDELAGRITNIQTILDRLPADCDEFENER